ncbi:MAG: hypothetical protein JSV97_13555 [candidate division WOR-3 bacterium]|nr:MAG: hypothetical protein JSV97_13555 [candidate division WOR-3 bacterium]
MSRNKQRTTAAASAPTPAMEAAPAQPATLSYVTPTEFVELPSRGQFYSPEHPLHNKEVVEMRYMTARDEDILTSRSLLKNGLAIERLLENLIVDSEVQPNNLLIGDKNALLVAARVSGYGENYNVTIKCPSCNTNVAHDFDLSALSVNHGVQPDEDNASGVHKTDRGTFIAELPRTKFSVEFRLLTGEDEIYLSKASAQLAKLNLPDAGATNLLKRLVVEVNGVNTPSEIHNFIDNMPAQDARHLRACVQVVTPNLDMTQSIECSSCGAVTEMEVPFTSEFFWPKQ